MPIPSPMSATSGRSRLSSGGARFTRATSSSTESTLFLLERGCSHMRLNARPLPALAAGFLFITFAPSPAGDLRGFTAESSKAQREWEAKFRAIPSPDSLREYMRRLSARPHHVGSPYDKDNAEWLLAKFKSFGLDAHIETFDVLFPTPTERVVELVAPTKFVAKLQEPVVPGDPTSGRMATPRATFIRKVPGVPGTECSAAASWTCRFIQATRSRPAWEPPRTRSGSR